MKKDYAGLSAGSFNPKHNSTVIVQGRREEFVSVIIPTYQREKYIGDAVDSVLSQSYGDLEVLIIDDGSTDGTSEIIRSISKCDSRVRYVHQRNRGPAAARNKGFEIAQGDFIAFLDSDDLWLPEKLQKQMRIFQGDSSIDFVCCNGYAIDPSGKRTSSSLLKLQTGEVSDPLELLLKPLNIFLTPGVIFRSKCLRTAGIFDESLKTQEDVDLWIRILIRHRGYFLDEDLVAIRRHSGNFAEISDFDREFETALCNWKLRSKAVALYEKERRLLTSDEKQKALYNHHADLIKESLAQGIPAVSRSESYEYCKQHPFRLQSWVFLSLSHLPASIVSRIIRRRRKRMLEQRCEDQSQLPS